MLNVRLMILAMLVFGLAPPAFSQNNANARLNPQIQEAEELHQAGYGFFIAREYRKAPESFMKELSLRRAASDTLGKAWALNQIGESHLSLGEYQKALNSYNQAAIISSAEFSRPGKNSPMLLPPVKWPLERIRRPCGSSGQCCRWLRLPKIVSGREWFSAT